MLAAKPDRQNRITGRSPQQASAPAPRSRNILVRLDPKILQTIA
jgi:hypothetical protein